MLKITIIFNGFFNISVNKLDISKPRNIAKQHVFVNY
jgi:hypothetical protein